MGPPLRPPLRRRSVLRQHLLELGDPPLHLAARHMLPVEPHPHPRLDDEPERDQRAERSEYQDRRHGYAISRSTSRASDHSAAPPMMP